MMRSLLLLALLAAAVQTATAQPEPTAYPVTLVTPTAGTIVEPEAAGIAVSLHGLPPAVDRDQPRPFVNGADVTEQSERQGAFLLYRPAEPLPSGRVLVRVALRDTAGRFLEAVEACWWMRKGYGSSSPPARPRSPTPPRGSA